MTFIIRHKLNNNYICLDFGMPYNSDPDKRNAHHFETEEKAFLTIQNFNDDWRENAIVEPA